MSKASHNTFCISPSWKVEAIASLISIHFHLDKLIGCHHLRVVSLSKQHMLNSLLDIHHSKQANPYCMATSCLTPKQCLKIKSPIVNTNNCLNQVLPAFDSLNKELSLEFCLIDNFPNCFFFHIVDCKDVEARTAHYVQNNIATSVLHIRREHEIIKKTIYHVINDIFTEAELFTMRCGISQASQIQDITYIIVTTNAILAAKRIFDVFLHLYQLNFIVISSDLKKFFNKNSSNIISFWDCSSDNKWPPHLLVDKELKFHKLVLCYLVKHYGTSVEKKNVILLSRNGKYTFKYPNTRKEISSI